MRLIKKKKDEKLAEEFAAQMIKEVIRNIYTDDELKELKEKIAKFQKKD